MTDLLVLGAAGQLGSELISLGRSRGLSVLPAGNRTGLPLDIRSNKKEITELIFDERPSKVINCISIHGVECSCSPLLASEVNALPQSWIASACKMVGALFIYISTDEVFSGGIEPGISYKENSERCPHSVYGMTKALGEMLAEEHLGAVARTSHLFGPVPTRSKGNIVTSILRSISDPKSLPLKYFDNRIFSPSYAPDVARMLLRITSRGTYHLVNSGQCSAYTFAKTVLSMIGSTAAVERQRYSRDVNTSLLPSLRARRWEEALREYLTSQPGVRRPDEQMA